LLFPPSFVKLETVIHHFPSFLSSIPNGDSIFMSDFDNNPYAVTNVTDDYGYDETPVDVPDYFVASIVSAFFCLPFGIPAIILQRKQRL